ncbi:MAG: type IV secretion system DNA-binding domain-containing protein [Planctomycetota bacterium]
MFLEGHSYHAGFLLNSWELTSLLHVPPAHLLQRRKAPITVLETLRPEAALDEGTPVGICDDAGCEMLVCIPKDTRMEHTHLIGTTGQGKSTVMLHMMLDDIRRGEGLALFDPHGHLVDDLLSRIPVEHTPRVIYIDPGGKDWVPLWNPLRSVSGQDPGRVADDLVGAFRAFVTGWGHRLEHLLRHAILAVLHLPDGTLQDVADLLRKKSDESERLRSRIAPLLENRLTRSFWQEDFLRYGNADLSPPQHKLSRLLASGNVSYMLSQPENRIDLRDVMDTGKILVVNLATIGSETREVLGCFMLSLLRLAAISRSDIPPAAQKRFHIYCDEAHRFITDSIEDLIEETRKYNVSLALAHQYMSQFSTRKSDAIWLGGPPPQDAHYTMGRRA